MQAQPVSHDFCPVCNMGVPLAKNRQAEYDIEGSKVIVHQSCQRVWLSQEASKIILAIIEDIKGLCAESRRFCKKTKRWLRRERPLNELRLIFQNIVFWVKERIGYFTNVPIQFLDRLCNRFNYLAEQLSFEKEIISFPLPLR